MNDDSTGNDGPLSLAERARLGLLADALRVDDILQLEQPTDRAARKALSSAIRAAVAYGDLTAITRSWQRPGSVVKRDFLRLPPVQNPTVQCVETQIDRESYRAWRAQCPATLLSPLSQIHKWLGATPAVEALPPALPSLPEPVANNGIALVEAENAALVSLRIELKREPDFEEFWDYLTTRDDTGTVADCTSDRLDWIGRTGKPCSTAKNTIRNRLTAAKKRNPFTPN